jgi:uncharacterized membrane protein
MKFADLKPSRGLLIAMSVLHVLMWGGGIACFSVWPLSDEMRAIATPVFLWNASVIMACLLWRHRSLALLWAGTAGFAIEVLGVQTGFPFGGYTYTDQFGFALFGTPVVLSAAWFLLISYSRFIVAGRIAGRSLRALLGAGWMMGIDLVLEPVATGPMRAWSWHTADGYYGVPVTNFAAWFIISFVMLRIMEAWLPAPKPDRGIVFMGTSLLLFFTTIALLHQLMLAGFIGIAMLSAQTALFVTRHHSGLPHSPLGRTARSHHV